MGFGVATAVLSCGSGYKDGVKMSNSYELLVAPFRPKKSLTWGLVFNG